MWLRLKERYADRVEFEWKLALMSAEGLPTSKAQCDWFYKRSGTIVRSPFMLNSGWYDASLKEYLAPNLVAEAAKDLGIKDDRVRLAITHASMREGQRVGDWEVSAAVGATAAGLNRETLLERARQPEIEARARATTAEFHNLQVNQRPTFLLEDAIGDRAVFSGLIQIEPLAAAIDAMLADTAAYAAHAAHFGTPPS
jgi:hypothetical protein